MYLILHVNSIFHNVGNIKKGKHINNNTKMILQHNLEQQKYDCT